MKLKLIQAFDVISAVERIFVRVNGVHRGTYDCPSGHGSNPKEYASRFAHGFFDEAGARRVTIDRRHDGVTTWES